MKRSATADLPLHYGQVRLWFSERIINWNYFRLQGFYAKEKMI
ncbi:hypothetical protein [Flavobacterium denitrificans]|nr:hypothetical protein [Flavobacterium denitrificans]